jgi:tRNA U54 and U55 pseudouridine synthase Pus10
MRWRVLERWTTGDKDIDHRSEGRSKGAEAMNCKICGEPIKLVPSAQERAKTYGKTPEYYTNLFTTHSWCELHKREESLREFLAAKQEKSNELEHS